MPKAKITALGCYTPPGLLTNQDLEKMVDTNDQWILDAHRHPRAPHRGPPTWPPPTWPSKPPGARWRSAASTPSEVNAIIVCTVTPDYMFPSTACLVQNGIGARGAWGFDLIAACSGFVYGSTVGAHLVAAGTHKKVLVIGADTMSRIIDYTDRATCVLFGDGAGAMLHRTGRRTAKTDLGFIDFLGEIDGSGGDALKMPAGGSRLPASHETVDQRLHYVHQDGPQVFKYAVRKMYETCRDLLARNGLTGDDVAVMIPHQANMRIINAAGERLGIAAGEGDDQHRPLRQHHRRHHSAGHPRCHPAGPPQEGRPGAVGRRGRRLHRGREPLALGVLRRRGRSGEPHNSSVRADEYNRTRTDCTIAG